MSKRVAVLGAGIVGLTSAVNIQRLLPECDVTVIADRFSPDTTSDGAAGIFMPGAPGVPDDVTRDWSTRSFRHFNKLMTSPDARTAGVFMLSGYYLMHEEPKELPLCHDIIYCCRRCTPQELESLPGNFSHGLYMTTLMIESQRYLPYLLRQFKRDGGKVREAKIHKLSELEDFDVVVNCAGRGVPGLLQDPHMVPVRGQLTRVKAPWLKHFLYDAASCTYVIPCADDVVLGGFSQRGRDEEKVDESDADDIWRRCSKLIPSVKDAAVAYKWAGVRPYREPLRLEVEERPGLTTFVHNYGHGANGVALSWGTAEVAAEMVQNVIRNGQRRRRHLSSVSATNNMNSSEGKTNANFKSKL